MIVPLGGEETLLCCSVPLLPWRWVGGQLEICRLCLNSVSIMIKIIYSVIMIVFVTTIRNQYFTMPSVFECVWQGCFSAKENSLFVIFWLCFVALSVKYWFVLKCNHCSISIIFTLYLRSRSDGKPIYGSQSCCFFSFLFFWPSSTQHSALKGCVKLHSWQKVKNVIPLHLMCFFLSSFAEITLKLLFPWLFKSKHIIP